EAIAGIEQRMRHHMESRGIAVDYAAIVDARSLEPLAAPHAPAVALVAGRLGSTRLIDNCELPPRHDG
ncbi:MAG: pantoate--beta-alanine ligase, partial [Pirellulales bacterium]